LRDRDNTTPAARYNVLYPESLVNDALWQAVRHRWCWRRGGLGRVDPRVGGGANGSSGAVRSLERRTRQIAAGDFSPMPRAQPRRVRDLAQSVNEMAHRLGAIQDA